MEQISKPLPGSEVTVEEALRAPEYASLAEVEAALNALTDNDFLKLMMIASVHCHDRNLAKSVMEPQELLNQAVLKTLQCERGKRWNKKVSLIRHLDRAMENISGHLVGEIVRERAKIVAFSDDLNRESNNQPASRSKDADAAQDKVVALLNSAFGDDKQGKEVFGLRAQRYRPAEIQSRLGISPQEYETINRRILRKISRLAK